MAPHSSILAWKIPWTEEPGRLQSMGWWRVRHDWASSLSLFTFMNWRRKWQPTPVLLPGESQGWGSLMGCCLWGHIVLPSSAPCYEPPGLRAPVCHWGEWRCLLSFYQLFPLGPFCIFKSMRWWCSIFHLMKSCTCGVEIFPLRGQVLVRWISFWVCADSLNARVGWGQGAFTEIHCHVDGFSVSSWFWFSWGILHSSRRASAKRWMAA